MASNPIQKKVRNAGLAGAAITLIIMGIVVGYLLMLLSNMKKEEQKIEESYIDVYTINQDVKSGQIITEDMLQVSVAQIQHVPENATRNLETFENYSLMDGEGNKVYTDEIGLFLTKKSEYMEIYKEGSKYYTYTSQGKKEEVTGVREFDIQKDDYGMFIVRATSDKMRVYQEEATEEYYILKVNGTKREKEYIKILGAPLIAKIGMKQNTVLTLDMLALGQLLEDDIRKQEYNAIILPTDLTTGDYIDIRLQLPTGQDFIVASKKMVELPIIDGVESEDTIWLNLSEDEIIAVSCSIVESYRITGSKLYATKYADPGMQEEAEPTYPLNAETVDLIKANPNVTEIAQKALRDRYTKAMLDIRNEDINKELEKEENSLENVAGKMEESIAKTQSERKKYLESLMGGTIDDDEDYEEE